MEGSDEDEYRTAYFQTETEEASLRVLLKLKEEQVEVLSRRTQGEEFPSRDDSVALVMPLSKEMRITGEGRAILR